MRGVLRLGQVCGIPIHLQYGWFLLFGLFSWLLAGIYFPERHPDFSSAANLLLGVLGSALLFCCVVLHELAHSLVARKNGLPTRNITLFLFGGVAQIQGEPDSPTAELKMAAAGPALSLAIALASLALTATNLLSSPALDAIFQFLFTFNLMLAAFNLTPAFPMDGGRILHAGIWYWRKNLPSATRSVTLFSQLLSLLMMLAGLYLLAKHHPLNGSWLLLLGWFLRRTALASYLHVMMRLELSGRTVAEFMTSQLKVLHPEMMLADAWRLFLQPYHYESFPVLEKGPRGEDRGERLAGLLLTRDVKRLRSDERALRRVRDLMLPVERLSFIEPGRDAYEAWQAIRHERKERLLVADGDPSGARLLGILTQSDLERRIGKL